jgi:D-tyrosyl-tRNA(Tyr) deacylase
VSVAGQPLAEIGPGLVVLVGVRAGDGDDEARWLAAKIAGLRVFEDAQGKMNLSLLETHGEALVISQFTLYGDARRGRRPSFSEAAPGDVAAPLVERFCALLADEGVRRVATGRFGAMMMVEIHNDGPVTILLDSDIARRGNPKVTDEWPAQGAAGDK